MSRIRKILIANRGEIAVRIALTASKMGILTVGVAASGDSESLHAAVVDNVVSLGSDELNSSYLNIGKIISAARETRCDAIHPGYGFLAENRLFAEACAENGIIFIGPSPEIIRLMGSKVDAARHVQSLGIPVPLQHAGAAADLLRLNGRFTYPALVKASAGGGGKAIQHVFSASELKTALETGSREAESFFGESSVYIEQYIQEPRHIEVQIIGDNYGNIVHLFERECTLQRRFQKVIEEGPSPTLNPQLRNEITAAALRIARSVEYTNAGTVEFLLDNDNNYFFLEMNTRLQVEHPVTELVTGVDIVQQQIEIASGMQLPFGQDDILPQGHAIEARVYADDPGNNFRPSPGEIRFYREPEDKSLARIDTGIKKGSVICPDYDPLLLKVIAHASSRNETLEKLLTALDGFVIHGIDHNIGFLMNILKSQAFKSNKLSVSFIERNLPELVSHKNNYEKNPLPVYLAAAALVLTGKKVSTGEAVSVWERVGLWRQLIIIPFEVNGVTRYLEIPSAFKRDLVIHEEQTGYHLTDVSASAGQLTFTFENVHYTCYYSYQNSKELGITCNGNFYKVIRKNVPDDSHDPHRQYENPFSSGNVYSPIHGRILKILVGANDVIKKDDPLIIIESMKMENKIVSPAGGKVKRIHIQEGTQVQQNTLMIEIE